MALTAGPDRAKAALLHNFEGVREGGVGGCWLRSFCFPSRTANNKCGSTQFPSCLTGYTMTSTGQTCSTFNCTVDTCCTGTPLPSHALFHSPLPPTHPPTRKARFFSRCTLLLASRRCTLIPPRNKRQPQKGSRIQKTPPCFY